MPCSSCGAELQSDSQFCPQCGTRLEGAQGKPPAETADRFRDSVQHGNNNVSDEQELWQGGYSGKAMIGSWCLATVASIVLIAIGVMAPPSLIVVLPLAVALWIFLAGLLAYRKLSVNYELTTQRFIHKVGILRQVTDRIEVIDIDDVTFEQGIIQRMLGVGTIKVASSDRTHPELALRGIDEVQRIADLIDDVRRQERRSRGLHIETI